MISANPTRLTPCSISYLMDMTSTMS
uniref:Uncharacterized protein n=1 Tax=Rhizophora mucronata TaxID=61149 RepID=A0A2P2PUP4_RHIMU